MLDTDGSVQCRPCDFSDFETALKYIKPVGRECNMDEFNTVPIVDPFNLNLNNLSISREMPIVEIQILQPVKISTRSQMKS